MLDMSATSLNTSRNPFSISPDPSYLYLTEALHVLCDKVRFTLDERQGLSVVYGEVGHGKSTVMRHLYSEYHARADCTTVSLLTPKFSTELGLLKAICGEFRLPIRHARISQESELRDFLLSEYAAGRNCVLFVDEAQMMKGEVLELVRTLLNYETDSAKLINIILFAQLELRDRLKDPSKKALRSRVFLYSTLDPLSIDDTERMLEFRCERARSDLTFEPDAVRLVYELSKGVPRDLLKICETAWLFARRNKSPVVPAGLIEMAAEHVQIGHSDE